MTTGHVFIAASLDGFIARRDGGLDWLMKHQTEGEDHGYDAFMASIDGLVMGRSSFETVLGFDEWSYGDKPVRVMSRTSTEASIPEALRGSVQLSNLTPELLMQQLDSEGWKRAYIDGGKLVQSFLRAGLISSITLTHIPILIGEGRPLFGELAQDIDLEHVETRAFPSGLVSSEYRIS